MNIVDLISWAVLGPVLVSYALSRSILMLDETMDFHGVFYGLRRYLCVQAIKRAKGDVKSLQKAENEARKLSIGPAKDAMNNFFWGIAKIDARFLGWVCIKCMTTRLSLFLFMVLYLAAVIIAWDFWASHKGVLILSYFIATFVNIATSHYLTEKI